MCARRHAHLPSANLSVYLRAGGEINSFFSFLLIFNFLKKHHLTHARAICKRFAKVNHLISCYTYLQRENKHLCTRLPEQFALFLRLSPVTATFASVGH